MIKQKRDKNNVTSLGNSDFSNREMTLFLNTVTYHGETIYSHHLWSLPPACCSKMQL